MYHTYFIFNNKRNPGGRFYSMVYFQFLFHDSKCDYLTQVTLIMGSGGAFYFPRFVFHIL